MKVELNLPQQLKFFDYQDLALLEDNLMALNPNLRVRYIGREGKYHLGEIYLKETKDISEKK